MQQLIDNKIDEYTLKYNENDEDLIDNDMLTQLITEILSLVDDNKTNDVLIN